MNNILFYASKSCIPSNLFIKKLHDEDMLKNFRLIDVLELKTIPPAITGTPTIIVKNINVPLVGQSAFNWLENSKFFYQKTNNCNNKIINVTTQSDNGLSIENRFNKKTDDFANLKDEDDVKRTAVKFNGATQNISITNIDNIKQTINDQKINQDSQNARLNELLKLRNAQILQLIKKNNENANHI